MEASTKVCNRFPLTLLPGTGGHYKYLGTASKRNAACFLELVKDLPTGMSIMEHFGGVGAFSVIVQEILKPHEHRVWDLDDDCVHQLKTISGVVAEWGDARDTMGRWEADLVVLDFPVATIRSHSEWPWDRVMARKPRYIIWSDTALRRLGLHRELYSKFFGTSIETHRDYVEAYSHFIWEQYGYSVTRVAHHVYSYLLAQPGLRKPIDIVKVVG